MPKYNYDINAAMQAGVTPEQITAYFEQEKQKGNSYNVQGALPTTPQDAKLDSGGFEDWLPTIGAIGGSFISPILGTAAGAAAGTALKQAIKGKADVGEIAKEAAFAGAGGAVGKGLGFVAGKVLPKIGGGIENAGTDLTLKAIRPNKTQLTKYAQQHGEDMAQVVKRYNIAGRDATGIEDSAIAPLQEQFSNIVKSSKIQIDPAAIDAKLYDKVTKLLQSPATEDHQLAEKLLLEYESVAKTIGGKPVTGEMVNGFRQAFDSKVKNWLADPIQSGKNRIMGSTMREVLQDAADSAGLEAGGQSFKQAGLELSKLYHIRDLAELQSNLGRGNLPVGLMTLLGIGGGGAIAGVPGGAVGAAGIVGLTKLANNPKAITAYSKLISGAGKRVAEAPGSVPMQLATQTVGQGAVRAPSLLASQTLDSQTNSNNNNEQQDFNHPGSIPQANQLSQADGMSVADAQSQIDKAATLNPYNASPQDLYREYVNAYNAGDGKTATFLKKMFDDEVKFQKDNTAKTNKPMNSASAQMLGKSNAANAALDRVSRELLTDPNKLLLLSTPGAPGVRQLEADYSSIADAIGGLRTGASVSPLQQKYYRNLLPKLGDSPKTIQSKLAAVQAELQFYIQNGANVTDAYGSAPGAFNADPSQVSF